LAFREPLFGLRQCNNRCSFCFVQQMPKGLRPSLYLRDDDYRYSFLLGNFVTLTNLQESDWQRIGEQRLSPLYVSIHATNVDIRRRLLGNPRAEDIVPQLRRLGEMGIAVHGQVVIVPGANDGEVLRETIRDLRALWPTVRTLALVPVGLTRYHRGGARLLRPDEARAVLRLASEVIPQTRESLGATWLYPSDELYLLAEEPIPPASFYDDDAQRENGVGLVRSLLDDWRAARRSLARRRRGRTIVERTGAGQRPRRITWICGALIAPILVGMAAEFMADTGVQVAVMPVANRFFGESATVSGLLTGGDVVEALAGQDLGERVFLPRAMFDAEGERTLDDLTPDALSQRLGAPVSLVSTVSEVLAALRM
ncbi:MAG: DUF512 domain-containing protein, partial [Chloroflexi bacterium]|nr:DUF512 domain-containing protein [Chloroflexota bacterium]